MKIGDLVRFTIDTWSSCGPIDCGEIGLIIETTEDDEVIVFLRGWELKGDPSFLEVINESR